MKNLPKDWVPPVDAWQAEFAKGVEEVVFAYFGSQRSKGTLASDFEQQFRDVAAGQNAPEFTTRAEMVDATGYHTDLFISYWPSRVSFETWWSKSTFARWWEDDKRTQETSGYFREIYSVVPNRFETLFSSRNPTGAGSLGEPLGNPVREHNYWGGMRDRIADSAHDDLASQVGSTLPKPRIQPSRGRRINTKVPSNLCLIRSGQDWGDCGAEELETYLDVVRPKLTAGMAFLRDNPIETGCLSCRLMDETNLDGSPSTKSFGLALFLSMKHLEDWSKSHPTHLAIFKSFFELVESRGGEIDLKLWHEVLVADARTSIFEYVNCHPNTGMLPYLNLGN